MLKEFCKWFIKKDDQIMEEGSIPKCFAWGYFQGTVIGCFVIGVELFISGLINSIIKKTE